MNKKQENQEQNQDNYEYIIGERNTGKTQNRILEILKTIENQPENVRYSYVWLKRKVLNNATIELFKEVVEKAELKYSKKED